MNPPDSKHSMNPNPNPNFYHPERGFMAGTGEPGNWKSLITSMTLVSWLSRSIIPTRNRNTRCLWPSLIPSRGTTRLENPDSGHPDYQVQLDGSDVFGFNHRESSDSGSRWFSRVPPSNETTVVLATGYNEALDASVVNEFYRLRLRAGDHAPAPLAVRERFSTPSA